MRFVCVLLILLLSNSTRAEEISHFENLKSLVGEWKKEESDGKDFYISFQSSANGSVLIENWIYKGESHSLTVYHPDGRGILATHYCPQGNQPRLKLAESNSEGVISFVFQDATNLSSIDESHLHSLSFEFIDEDSVVREESYIKSGTVTPSALKLVRQ